MKMKILQASMVTLLLIINAPYTKGSDEGCSIDYDKDNFLSGSRDGGESILISWDKPTEREDEGLLLPNDILGYLIIGVAFSQDTKFYDYMVTIDPDNYNLIGKRTEPQFPGITDIKPDQIGGIFHQPGLDLDFVAFVTCGEKTALLLKNMSKDIYSFSLSTVAKGGGVDEKGKPIFLYSKLTEKISKTVTK
jgi:hypothetical protein